MTPAEFPYPSIIPVILCGGSGTRLWPLSQPERPKQLLSLVGPDSMIQLTTKRTFSRAGFTPPLIVANARHAEMIEEQVRATGEGEARLILEPVSRNTAPAIALAAIAAGNPAAPLLVMPSDHVIADLGAFHEAVQQALPLVREGWLVTFGITPTAPETGYGYIRMGAALSPAVRQVERFVEKPDADKARAMIAEGGHAWNAGIFMFRADTYLAALEKHQPEMFGAVLRSMEMGAKDGQCIIPSCEHFSMCPSDSIDYAVMEKADSVAVIPVDMGWSDLGSWDALHAINACDKNGNACRGEVLALETRNCLIHSEGPRVSLVGVEDLIVVATGKDILILPRGRSQEVRKIIEALEKD